jgi:hypothetical protein
MRKELTRGACQMIRMNESSRVGVPMKYTTSFYRHSANSTRAADCFADPTVEFPSLEEARTFAQAAANATQFETRLFRIATADRNINEHWIKDGDDWKLIPSRYRARRARGGVKY